MMKEATGAARTMCSTGASSARLAEFGLLQAGGTAEGYCLSEDVGKLEASFYLAEDPHGNVVVHAAPWLPDGIGAEMPAAVTAADLAQSMDTREREAGLGMLGRLLGEHRNV